MVNKKHVNERNKIRSEDIEIIPISKKLFYSNVTKCKCYNFEDVVAGVYRVVIVYDILLVGNPYYQNDIFECCLMFLVLFNEYHIDV